MTGMQEQWQKISENLRGVLNPGIFKVWIHPLDAHIEGNSLCLAAPSEYVARWLRDRMRDTLRSAAAPVLQVAPENIDIRISCQGAAPAPAAPVSSAPAGGEQITSPMPGNILSVNISAGDTVKKGQVLMILEAMKMENEIMSPCDGKVVSVSVSKGAAVEYGTLLCVIG